jgi:hypothetical protein
MKRYEKGTIVYVKDAVGSLALRRGEQYVVEEVNGAQVRLKRFVGGNFSIHRFTTVRPKQRIIHYW